MAPVCAHALEAGIEADYAKSLIRRRGLTPEAPPLAIKGWPWAFRVNALGSFRLLLQDAPLAAVGKAQRRPLELLQVLIAQGGERVPEERVTEALWPRIEGDSAHRSFTSTLHRLRKLLGEDRAVVLHEGKLTLDRRYFWIDTWAFEELVTEIDAALRSPGPAPDVSRVESGRVELFATRLLELYRGPFLAGEAEAAWQLERRNRLRSRFARAAAALGRYWELSGQAARAADLQEKCFEIDSLARGGAALSHK